MAEELAFHQFGRYRAAVDRYERALGTWSRIVDQSCHEFLSGARFARDMDSPEICTGAWDRATLSIMSRNVCIGGESPSRRDPVSSAGFSTLRAFS
jgi:hypothetical protein